MKNRKLHIQIILLLFLVSINSLAQNNKTLLLRDSNDFKERVLNINTRFNEFSPINYKGGLLYISDKPLSNTKLLFNKIYWTKDSHFQLIDTLNKKVFSKKSTSKTYDFTVKNHDYTPATSNDNDILFNYKKIRNNWNEVELQFKHFSTNQAFVIDEINNLIIYSKESSLKYGQKKRWELWEAKIKNGRLINRHKIIFKDKYADYLYPYLSKDGNRLYFSSNTQKSKGGYDLFYINKLNGVWDYNLNQLENVNSTFDELSPFINNDTLYFSSNRVGGLGGFDIFYSKMNSISPIINLGYPINSEKDEVSLKKDISNFFNLTSNRSGNFDIIQLKYNPIFYNIVGELRYKNDNSLAKNHQFILLDNFSNQVIDTLLTDNNAKYTFIGKPNREYQFVTLNGDSVTEFLSISTKPNQSNLFYPLVIRGRSPKQINDSLDLIARLNQQKLDSIALMNLNNKFIVYYGFDKSRLAMSEYRVLDSLLSRLKRDTNLNVIIGAFTDCAGSFKYNTKLSIKRATHIVEYLTKNGFNKNRIISNGYSKNYSIIPCNLNKRKNDQKLNRRAEIVLSENKLNDWAKLEEMRGSSFYTVYSTLKKTKIIKDTLEATVKLKSILAKKDTVVKVVSPVVKKDTIAKVVKPIFVKKDTVVKVLSPVVKKDTIAKVVKPIFVKKDTVVKVLLPVVKKDTIAKVVKTILAKKDTVVKVVPPVVKKDTITKVVKPILVKKDTVVKVVPPVVKKDTIAKVVKPVLVKKDTLVKVVPPVVKKDTIAKVVKPVLVKKDTVAKVVPPVVKKDTIAKVVKPVLVKKDTVVKVVPPVVKKDTIAKVVKPVLVKKDTVVKVVPPVVKKDSTLKSTNPIVAKSSDYDDEISKDEILKALDSLAKLKREQERIIEYLTKRINKKPIDVFVNSDSVDIEIYDNGIHDNDSVSIIYNNRIVVDKQELKVNRPIRFKLKVDKNKKYNELVMVAENLGSEPPNTAVMFVTEKSGRRQQILLNTDMTHNEVVYFIRIGKE